MANSISSLGQILKSYRKSKKLTLRDVEGLAGVSNAYLSQLENDKVTKPSANILYKLSNVYNADFDYLLELAGIIEKKQESNKPKTLEGFALYAEDLTEEEERELSRYLKFLRYSEKGNN